MKKLILTSMLSLLVFLGFTSANTLDGFSSDSDIIKFPITEQILTVDISVPDNFNKDNSYLCVYSSPSPYTIYLDSYVPNSEDTLYVSNSNVYCFPLIESLFNGGDEIGIYSDFYGYGEDTNVFQNGTLYLSNSPITYSSSGGGSSSDSSTLLPNGISELTPVVTGVSTIVGEFIPYVIYCSIGILLAVLGFVAIKRLMNYMTRKITSIFSSKRRK